MWFLILGCAKQGAIGVPTPASTPSLVYRVERDGKVSHVFGTCHLPLPLEDRVDPALITGAREVWIEAELDGVDPLEVMGMLLRTDGTTLSEELDRDVFTALARRAGAAFPATMLDRVKPWAAAVTLGLEDLRPSGTSANDAPLDLTVTGLARDAGVPVRAVETLEDQLALFDEDTTDLASIIRPSAAEQKTNQEAGQAMLDLCERNDLTQVPRSLYAVDERFLSTRNHLWIPQLLPSLAEGGAFVSVGALHLPGKDGLLNLLAAEGYTISNVPRPKPPEPVPTYASATRWQDPVLMPIEVRDAGASKAAALICQEAENPIRACFFPSEQACTERLTHDVQICLDAHYTSMEQLARGEGAEAFQVCTVSGVVAEAVGRGWPDREACAPMRQAVEAEAAQKGLFDGAEEPPAPAPEDATPL